MAHLISPRKAYKLANEHSDKYLQLKTVVANKLNIAISAYALQGSHMAIISTSDLLTSLNSYLNDTSENKSFHFELNTIFLKELLNNVITDANDLNTGRYMLECVNNDYIIILWYSSKLIQNL